MTGVLLRCPNCGTTKSSFGECDACHEAQVRYYCTNHTPGKWLDSPKCGTCGEVFGERKTPPAPSRPPAPAPSAARPSTRPSPRPHGPPARGDGGPTGDMRGRERVAPEAGRSEEPVDRRDESEVLLTRWQDMLKAAARGRAPRGPIVADETVPARRGMGCFLRAVLIFLFFILTLTGGLFVVAGSMFRMF